MVWGIYLGLEKRLQEHLENPQHKVLLENILKWQSKGGTKEVERCLLEMIDALMDKSGEDD